MRPFVVPCGPREGRPCRPSARNSFPPAQASSASECADRAAACYADTLQSLAQRPGQAIALAMSVPFCAARCLCCDRDVRAAQPAEVIDDYVDGLVDELRAVAARLGGEREVLQWHLGGGTANELGEAQLSRLVETVQSCWQLPADAAMSVECDPRRTGWAQLQALRGLGFRQISFGVLDLDPQVQQAIGRRHSAALIDDACEFARGSGFPCISLDLMIGLPGQGEASWDSTLGRVLRMAPDRVRLVRYRHRPREVPVQCAIDAAALPAAAVCDALATLTAARLCEAGYRWIGGDCFVLDGDEWWLAHEQGSLRRNLIGYSAVAPTPVLGVGVGAPGEVDGHRFWNEPAAPLWREALRAGRLPVAQARLAGDREQQRQRIVEMLSCRLEVPAQAACAGLEPAYGRLARHEPAGLVRVLADRIVVTEAGRHALALLCSEFDEPAADDDGARLPWLS